MLAGGTRGNPAREPVKAAVLRAIERDARLADLQRDLEGMPMTAAIGRALRRIAPFSLLQLPVSSEEAETFVQAWAFEATCEYDEGGEGAESDKRARFGGNAHGDDPVSAFIVAMLLDLTGMQLTGADLQFAQRAAAVAVHASANYDQLLEALWAEPRLDEFVMRLRYLSRPDSVDSIFGSLRAVNSTGVACNA
ncbi:hypothetical protein [Paraburkholderia youngii]|uniref:hypothetical protein n=1 Tax=Paraburkholderia youngii TaxID=2782701 RepID=UPI003D1C3591